MPSARLTTCLVALLAQGVSACTSGSLPSSASQDGGASSCTPQPENVRAQLCDISTKNTLYACDKGSSPPRGACAKTVQGDSYCCTDAVGSPADGGSDASTERNVPYPTDNIGWKARAGATRGDRIKNVTLPGYRPNTMTQAVVSLSELYDPQRKAHDVVVIVCSSFWADLEARSWMNEVVHASTRRVAVLAVIGEGGTNGVAATQKDLIDWHTVYPWATTALDPSFKELPPAFNSPGRPALPPWVAFIDARTMEIVSVRADTAVSNNQSEFEADIDAAANGAARY